MAAESKGATGSGLDRALEWAQDRRLDAPLLSGSQFEDDVRPVVIKRLLPWQRRIGDEMDRPGASTKPTTATGSSATPERQRPTDLKQITKELRAAAHELGVSDSEMARWAFKPNLTGIVVIHG